jgi:cyclohexyl-isocyanide hydratase
LVGPAITAGSEAITARSGDRDVAWPSGVRQGHDCAATHWAFVELLPAFGARHVPGRVVVDRNRITGGGVTAGIDFALRLAAEDVARSIQLGLEYDPAPPFASGHPDVADPALVARLRERLGPLSKRLGGEAASPR